MGRIFKAIFTLVVLGALAVVGFAYFGDMAPESSEQTVEITLPGGTSGN